MNPQIDQFFQDMTWAFSKAIVEVCRAIEDHTKSGAEFNRQSVVNRLKDAARQIPADSPNSRMKTAILRNIAVDLEGGDARPSKIPFEELE